jgi:pilus assembly protein Flp/PilA
MFIFALRRYYKLLKSYGFHLFMYLRLAFGLALPTWSPQPKRRLRLQQGQGLVEYALVLVLVAVVIIGILTVLGPQVGFAFFKVQCPLAGGTVVQYAQTEFYDCLLDPNGSNTPPNRIMNFNLETGEVGDFR